VFLDRDGVFNKSTVRYGKPFGPAGLHQLELHPEAAESLVRLKEARFLLTVVTDQPEVGRGTVSAATVEAMHEKLRAALPLDRIEICYDDGRTQDTDFGKPNPGMILAAEAALRIDTGAGFIVGDRWRDIDAGARAGCRTIFIDRGWRESLRIQPDFGCSAIAQAANHILDSSGRRMRGGERHGKEL
jgi:D-glycero-D-manno-heptose 1,7-bisphosphate phosphatase